MGHTPATRATALGVMRRRRAEWFAANGPCQDCGSDRNLHAHHRNPADKTSHKVWSWSQARREAELAKCVVLCAKCHQNAHFGTPKHGIKRYKVDGCRCAICKAARAEHSRRYRLKHPRVFVPRESFRDKFVVLA